MERAPRSWLTRLFRLTLWDCAAVAHITGFTVETHHPMTVHSLTMVSPIRKLRPAAQHFSPARLFLGLRHQGARLPRLASSRPARARARRIEAIRNRFDTGHIHPKGRSQIRASDRLMDRTKNGSLVSLGSPVCLVRNENIRWCLSPSAGKREYWIHIAGRASSVRPARSRLRAMKKGQQDSR